MIFGSAGLSGLYPPSHFTYTYEPNSDLLKTLTSPAHTVTNVYEPNRDVLAVKENKVGSTEISRYQYGVNSLGQRTSLAQTGSAFAWGFGFRVQRRI